MSTPTANSAQCHGVLTLITQTVEHVYQMLLAVGVRYELHKHAAPERCNLSELHHIN